MIDSTLLCSSLQPESLTVASAVIQIFTSYCEPSSSAQGVLEALFTCPFSDCFFLSLYSPLAFLLLQLVIRRVAMGDLYSGRIAVPRDPCRGALQAAQGRPSNGQTCQLHSWTVCHWTHSPQHKPCNKCIPVCFQPAASIWSVNISLVFVCVVFNNVLMWCFLTFLCQNYLPSILIMIINIIRHAVIIKQSLTVWCDVLLVCKTRYSGNK